MTSDPVAARPPRGSSRREPLSARVTSDVYWDELPPSSPAASRRIRGLTVEGLHDFVAEDVIGHNSIEQDADS